MRSLLMSMLSLMAESHRVVILRTAKIAAGGVGAIDEVDLMIREKVDTACEAVDTLASGRGQIDVVARYRAVVAANIARLSPGGSKPEVRPITVAARS
jgi:hypothetical protein